VENTIELISPEEYNTLHISPSAQTLGNDTTIILPSDVVIKRKVDGTYDNPAMTIND
jgi:hypothetical protein